MDFYVTTIFFNPTLNKELIIINNVCGALRSGVVVVLCSGYLRLCRRVRIAVVLLVFVFAVVYLITFEWRTKTLKNSVQ